MRNNLPQPIHDPEIKILSIAVRHANGQASEELPPERWPLYQPEDLMPWRIPNSYKNQKHLPGFFWMSQTKQMVSYESRLEMTTLKRLDFEEEVAHVLPQPVLLKFSVDGEIRRHVPDFLVWRQGRADRLLVNVKPAAYAARDVNRNAFHVCNLVTQRLKWLHRVYSEPDPVFLANLRWLAGYRRAPFNFQSLRPLLANRLLTGEVALGEWIKGFGDEAITKASAFHMLWIGEAACALTSLLDDKTPVRRGLNG